MNVVVSPIDLALPAAPLVLRNEAAWLPDPLPLDPKRLDAVPLDAFPLDELAITAWEGNWTTGRDAPEGPTPPTLQAAAAAAPAARLASIAARIGDLCIGGAERPTTASGESRFVGTVGIA